MYIYLQSGNKGNCLFITYIAYFIVFLNLTYI